MANGYETGPVQIAISALPHIADGRTGRDDYLEIVFYKKA